MAARPGTLKGEKPKEKPEFPSRPPPAAPTQSLDVQYFGRKSRRMKAILEKEDWTKAGPQYLGEDGVPKVPWPDQRLQALSSCTMAKGCKDQPKIPRKLTEQCVSVERS